MKVFGLDGKSGKVLWEQTAYDGPVADGRHRKSSFASATPVTDGRTVFVFFGTKGLYAYDFDGALKWKQDLGEIRTLGLGYATSPVLAGDLVIVQRFGSAGLQACVRRRKSSSALPAIRSTRTCG